ncbi:MAG: hypothetical protein H6667_22020 [Ardenticatenaceae bacterium]|nr:hypothetical protein [Ardenticatenaceae bacterium]MCB9444476.1 hypothetical protein [Ardenticatenaceae bacterium]
MRTFWKTAVFLFALFALAACVPTELEPGAADQSQTPTLYPLPEVSSTPLISDGITPDMLPLPLDEAPAALPIYTAVPEPIPSTGEAALAWAQSFGLDNAQVAQESEEMIQVFSRDEAISTYEQLTFIRSPYEQVIVYSSGIDWQNPVNPILTPAGEIPLILSSDVVTAVALDFVRDHNLLSEPLVAHEFPGYGENYVVHVAFAPDGLRLTGVSEGPGVTVRIDGNGRVVEARIIQAHFAAGETAVIQPLSEVYPAFLQGTVSSAFFYERAQMDGFDAGDPLRFQAHSLSYGEQGDRAELVYAPLPTQAERLVPMWLITRPYDQDWNHYIEFYLLAAVGEDVPRPYPSPTPPGVPPTPDTAVPTLPLPTRTPLAQTGIVPETLRIVPPLIVDSGNGRLYANAAVDGITQTVSLDAATGRLLTVYGLTGDLALDASRNLLVVDNYPYGLTTIDTATGQALNGFTLPPGERSHAHLQVDTVTGNALLFRDQMLLIADPLSETWQQTIPFEVEGTVCGEPMEEPPTIQQTWFDNQARLLYLTFIDYVCTPWVSYTVVVYDLNTMSEVARYPGVDYLSGAAVNGRFYAKSWFRLGKTFQWAWQNGQPWLEQIDRGQDFIGGFSGFQVDENRGRLYEITVNGLQVLDMETMAVLQAASAPVDGQLVGFDPVTDSLYFVGKEDGRFLIWPTSNLQN